MSKITQCDGCGAPIHDLPWVEVVEETENGPKNPQHFCGWRCLALWAKRIWLATG